MLRLTLMNKILRKIRKTFYLNQIRPGPRFGRLPTIIKVIVIVIVSVELGTFNPEPLIVNPFPPAS